MWFRFALLYKRCNSASFLEAQLVGRALVPTVTVCG